MSHVRLCCLPIQDRWLFVTDRRHNAFNSSPLLSILVKDGITLYVVILGECTDFIVDAVLLISA